MATLQQSDLSSESSKLVGKTDTVFAPWVYILTIPIMIGFFLLALQETQWHLTITTILYFLGAAVLTVMLFRLMLGRPGKRSIHVVVVSSSDRHSDQ
jgi:hypothetical protein